MKRVLIYSHDTFGLGNIRRMLEVARHLVDSHPDISVLIVTGSPMLHAFRIPQRIDYIKLPCLSRDTTGRYGARSLALSLEATVRLRANIISSVMADFAPDLVLVDKKPFGVEDELGGALAALHQKAQRPRLVLLLRDILDSPAATVSVWRKNGCFAAIEAFYDAVLVLGAPAVFDMRSEYQFPPFASAKLQFCGYIRRPSSAAARAQTRAALGLGPLDRLILVTPGGGEDGFPLAAQSIDALALLAPTLNARMHIVCGPEMRDAQRLALRAAASAHPQISLQDFSDDLMALMAAADVAVTMGGYNTICELLSLRRRAVVVPRVRPGLEQCIRAQRLADLGLVQMLHPDQLSATHLAQALHTELQTAPAAAARAARQGRRALGPLQGLAQCSKALLAQLGLSVQPTASTGGQPEQFAHDAPSANDHGDGRSALSLRGTPLVQRESQVSL